MGSFLFGTGLIAVGVTPSLDTVALGAFDKGVSQGVMVKVADGTQGLAVVNAPLFYFIAAHVIGAILLGVALSRGRVIPAIALCRPSPSATRARPSPSPTLGFARAGGPSSAPAG